MSVSEIRAKVRFAVADGIRSRGGPSPMENVSRAKAAGPEALLAAVQRYYKGISWPGMQLGATQQRVKAAQFGEIKGGRVLLPMEVAEYDPVASRFVEGGTVKHYLGSLIDSEVANIANLVEQAMGNAG
jgi:hypothetical protein